MTDTPPTPPTSTPPPDAPQPPPDTGEVTDWKAEAEKWKGLARKHEDKSKANAKAAADLVTLQQQSMTDQEKAVAKAKEEGRLEAVRSTSEKLVAAEVRAAAKGRLGDEQVKTLLTGLNLAAFVRDDGEVDDAAVKRWVESVTPTGNGVLDLGQGARGTAGTSGDMNRLIRQSAGRA